MLRLAETTVAVASDSPPIPRPPLRADSLVRGMALMLLLTIVQRGIGLFRNVMVCRLLDPEELGAWNLAYSFLLLAAPLVVWGIPGSFKRYLEYYRQRGQLQAFVRRASIVTSLLTVLGVCLLGIARRPLAWLVFGNPQAVDLFCVCTTVLVAVIAFNFVIELLTALRQLRIVSWLQFANSLLFTVTALLLASGAWRTAGIVVGYGVSCALTAAVAIWAIVATLGGSAADENFSPASTFWAKLLPFAAWFWLSDLLTNLFAAVDRYMIVHFAEAAHQDGLELVGQYHSSRVLGEVMVAVTCMVGGVLLSYMSCDWEQGRQREVARKLDLCLLWSCFALILVAATALLVAPVLFRFVLANKYVEGLAVMPLTMVACVWFGLLTIANNYLWCREKAWLASVAVSLGLVANATLNFWWLPRWGLAGAVAATAVANLAALAIVLALSQRLGMRYRGITWVAMGLPLTLCLGPFAALASVALVVTLGLSRGWRIGPADWDRSS